ncbi:MAG TPA: Rrf2 family transcriptional regulator, partial [Candidatus Methylomirabilis sp.]|nr:Rrf2 family transcriptional regulator [Candidatus Methylomirabilis sp.]
RAPSQIRLREVLEAIEGADLTERCIFWGRRCGDSNPCLLHAGWRDIKPHLMAFFDATTLATLARSEGNENGS